MDHERPPAIRPRRPVGVFIGPIDVAGYFGNLAVGFRAAGVPVLFMDETPDPFSYRPPTLHVKVARALVAASVRTQRGRARRVWALVVVALRAIRAVLRGLVLVVAVARCDTFIYSSGAGLFHGRELPLLRRLGKRIVWVFTGSDHRPPYLNGRMLRAASTDGWEPLTRATRRIRAAVALAEEHADFIVAHTASAQFHRVPFVRFLSIGIPVLEPEAARPATAVPDAASGSDSGPVTIVHGPSDPESKGTRVIRAIVERLVDTGRTIDYRELTDSGHDQVLATLADADLVVNEVWADTPMGVLAAEAAIRGVPSVSGGYYAPLVAADTPPEDVPPSVFVLPEALEEAVRGLVVDDFGRRELGRHAQRYVSTRWSARAVAERYLRLLAGTAPREWFVDPASLSYVGGWGIAREERLAALRDQGGAGLDLLMLPEGSMARDVLAREMVG